MLFDEGMLNRIFESRGVGDWIIQFHAISIYLWIVFLDSHILPLYSLSRKYDAALHRNRERVLWFRTPFILFHGIVG
jgi:hypothetical protein